MDAASRVDAPKDGGMMEAILSLSHISKVFKEPNGKIVPVLTDISLSIRPGEFFILLGPSGSGKSTILRIMSGLEKSFGGNLAYGADMKAGAMSFVFQQFALLPWMSVYDNVALGLVAHKEGNRRERVSAELKRLGLERFAREYPRELSGGMRQRVGIARALVTNPKIMFMDEPFSELDSFTAEELRAEVLRIWEETKTTIIMVTHLIPEAIELADRIAVLTKRPATIEKIIENKMPRPRLKRSKAFYDLEDSLYALVAP